ncbi:MAG: autotransporter-associated beta strand repeat-containing protein, partial [Tepidisphaeraceae bacterium]
MLWLASLSVAASPLFLGTPAWAQNTPVDVPNGTTELDGLSSSATNDLVFTSSTTYSPTAFTLSANLTEGTLDDLDSTQSLSISNPTATLDTLTLDGGANSVAPDAGDLIYVAGGGTLSISGGTTTPTVTPLLNIAFGSAGNLDIAGTASIGAALSGSGLITMTGGGTLTLSPLVASSTASNSGLTGGFVIANGAVNLGGATNAPNWGLGAAGGSVTLGNSASNATLNFTATASGVAQNFIIGGAGTDEITSSAGTATAGNAAIFAAAQTITLENNLIVSNNVSGSVPGTGNILGFRGVISQSGGTYGITVASTNLGTVDLRGANTFGGGVTIDAGSVSFNASGASNLSSGPFGTGTITLGGVGTLAATLVGGGAFNIYNPLIVAATSNASARTILLDSASATAPTIFSPITLNSDLTLTAVASTLTGVDRIRFGDGGITGSNNIIINNLNNATMTGVGSDAIRLDGNGTATAWTGNLIVEGGLGSIGGSSNTNAVSAIGSSNIVEIASGALFDYGSNTGGNSVDFSPTIAGLADYTGAGAVSGTGAIVFTIAKFNETLILGGSGNYSFSGVIQDSTSTVVATGLTATTALTVNLSATGSQILLGANTYSGGTTVEGGTLTVGAGGTLGASTGSLTVSNPNTGAGTDVVLNLSTSVPTTTGSLSGTIATPSSGTNTATINNGGQLFTVNQTTAATYAGTIAGTGSFTLGSLSTGTLTLSGASTYSGPSTIDAGTLQFTAASTGSPVVTSGPLGTGTVTLGGVSTLAATLADGGFYGLGNSLIVGATTNSSARTITENSSSTTAGVISGPITLNADLTLTAVATTRTDGADRLRVGSGGITGSNNIIINNLNNTSTSPTAKGAIRLDGTGAVTSTWTGNLIVEAGLGSLGTGATIDATSANNTVLIASGASFDFASNEGVSSGFSPTIAGLNDFGAAPGGTVFQSAPSNNTL